MAEAHQLQKRLTRVSITAPYHAKHLYDDSDVESIVQRTPQDLLGRHASHMQIYSTSEGSPIQATSFGSLLNIVVGDILRQPLRLDRMQDAISNSLKIKKPASCTILPVAAGGVDNLVSALKKREASPQISIAHDLATGDYINDTSPNISGRPEKSKIAIIGFSGRFPDADGIEEYWDLLSKGLDVHRQVPIDRWDVQTHFDPTGKRKNTSQVQYGCWIKNPGDFDARFFNLSPREATQSDPAQRIALISAYEALEMAGFVPDSSPSTQRDRVGIMLGTASDDYREVNSGQEIDTYFIPGGNRVSTSKTSAADLYSTNYLLGFLSRAHQLSLQVQRTELQRRHGLLFQLCRHPPCM